MKVLSIKREKQQPDTKKTALQIVDLIIAGTTVAIQEALAILNFTYREAEKKEKEEKVQEAYEMACLVALKLSVEKKPTLINVKADQMVLKASRQIKRGKIKTAFHLIKSALESDARPVLCRNVTYELLRAVRSREKIFEVVYGPNDIFTVEVARVTGVGFVIIKNHGSSRLWTPLKATPKKLEDELIVLKTEADLKKDLQDGLIEMDKTLAFEPDELDIIYWGRYLDRIMNERRDNEYFEESA